MAIASISLEVDTKTGKVKLAELSNELDKLDRKRKPAQDGLKSFSSSAGQMTGVVSRTSTTLARSADVFGLNAQALRALDDVMDVAGMGFENLSKSAAGFNVASIGVAGAGLAIGTAIGTWLNTFPEVREAADDLLGSIEMLFTGSNAAVERSQVMAGLKDWQKKIKAIYDQVKARAGALPVDEAGVRETIKATELKEKLAKASEIAKKAIYSEAQANKILGIAHKESAAGMKEVEQRAKDLAEAYQKNLAAGLKAYFDELAATRGRHEELADSQRDVSLEMGLLAGSVTDLSGVLRPMTEDDLRDLIEKLEELEGLGGKNAFAAQVLAAAYAQLGDRVSENAKNFESLESAHEGAKRAQEELARIEEEQIRKIQEQAQAWADLAGAIGDLVGGAFGALLKGYQDGIRYSIEFANATNMAAKAQAVLGAAMSAYKSGSALRGAATGAIFGAQFGPLGAILGGIGGGLLGLFGGAKKAREEAARLRKELEATRDAFIKSMGGLDMLKAKAAEAGVSLAAMFSSKTAAQLGVAIDKIKEKLERWGEAHTKLKDAMEKYGITVDQLGEKGSQQMLNEQALQLLESYKLLKAAGVDVAIINEKMAGDFSKYLDASIKSGTAIPEAMRPILEQMARSGELIKENGEAYTEAEVAGLNYSKTMGEMFDALIKKIEQLVNALLGISDVQVNPRIGLPGGENAPGPGGDRGRPPTSAAAGYGPRLLMEDTIFQAHKGEHVLIVPKGRPVLFRSALRGFEDFVPPSPPGMGGGSSTPAPVMLESAVSTTLAARRRNASSSELQDLGRQLDEILSRAKTQQPATTVNFAPAMTISENPIGTRQSKEELRRFQLREFIAAVQSREPALIDAIRSANR